jgi:hypothetical protein
MTNPSQPINPQQSAATPSGGGTTHEQSQWIIRTINEFSGKIGSLDTKSEGIQRDIARIEGDSSKISGIDSTLKTYTKVVSSALIIVIGLSAWGSAELYNLNKANGINSTKVENISKQLANSKNSNKEIMKRLDKLLANSANNNSYK